MIIGQAGDGVYIDDLVHRPEEDDGYLGELSRMRLEVELLRTENAELRELVRDYDKVLDDAVYVWGTVADFLGYGRKYDALHDRMKELGVEI